MENNTTSGIQQSLFENMESPLDDIDLRGYERSTIESIYVLAKQYIQRYKEAHSNDSEKKIFARVWSSIIVSMEYRNLTAHSTLARKVRDDVISEIITEILKKGGLLSKNFTPPHKDLPHGVIYTTDNVVQRTTEIIGNTDENGVLKNYDYRTLQLPPSDRE